VSDSAFPSNGNGHIAREYPFAATAIRGKERQIYVIGLDTHTARAIYADLAGWAIRRRRPLRGHSTRHRRRGRRPALLILGLDLADPMAELEAAREAWGQTLVAVGIGPNEPLARIWWTRNRSELIEIGPGFLARVLEPVRIPGEEHLAKP